MLMTKMIINAMNVDRRGTGMKRSLKVSYNFDTLSSFPCHSCGQNVFH